MVKADNSRYFYSSNDLYSVYALTDGDGTVVERYTYDPYGAVTIWDGNATTQRAESAYGNTKLFCGYTFENETGLYHTHNRYLSPELGRFLERNPWGYSHLFMTLYDYVDNCPSNSTEPFSSKRTWIDLGGGWKAGLDQFDLHNKPKFQIHVYKKLVEKAVVSITGALQDMHANGKFLAIRHPSQFPGAVGDKLDDIVRFQQNRRGLPETGLRPSPKSPGGTGGGGGFGAGGMLLGFILFCDACSAQDVYEQATIMSVEAGEGVRADIHEAYEGRTFRPLGETFVVVTEGEMGTATESRTRVSADLYEVTEYLELKGELCLTESGERKDVSFRNEYRTYQVAIPNGRSVLSLPTRKDTRPDLK